MTPIGNRIAKLREESELTQYELADKIKISKSVMNRIELGTRPVRDDELKAIALFFKVSADYLLGIIDIPDTVENYKRKISPAQDLLLDNNIQTQNLDTSNTYTGEEKTIIDKYRQLDERGKQRVLKTVNDEYDYIVKDMVQEKAI